MSIETEFQSTIQNVQNAYNGLNNLGATIPQDKTIENIKTCLDEIYDRLPKTEFEEGESVTLENTLKGKLDFDNGVVGIGQSSQDSTQGYNELNIYAVHSAGYTETVSGVTFKYNDDGSVTANGTATADINYFLGSRATLGDIFNGTYYLSGCTNGSNSTYYLSMWADGIGVYPQTTTEVATNKTSGANWNIVIAVKNGASVNYTFYPMMSKTSGKSFEPYTGGQASPNPSYPQTINSVTGNQDVVVSGKNKLNFSDVTLESHGVTLQIKDNYFILNGTNDGTESAFIISNYMTPFQTNANTKLKAFQISGTATGSIANPLFRTYTNWQNQVNVNFTSSTISDYSEEATYNTSIIAVHGGTFNNYKIGFMVADNLTSGDTYEPYITPTSYQLSLGDIELNAIGNYKDELIYDVDEDKVYKREYIRKIKLTSSMNWLVSGSGYWYYMANYQDILVKETNSDIISNYFTKGSWGTQSTNTICLGNSNSGVIGISKASFNSVEELKTFLNNNNVYAYAPLQVANDIPVTDTTLINQVKALYNAHSLNGTTIIEGNGDLPMIIKCRGLKGE